MVLDKNNVIYGGIDLTEEVINYIEGKYKEAALKMKKILPGNRQIL